MSSVRARVAYIATGVSFMLVSSLVTDVGKTVSTWSFCSGLAFSLAMIAQTILTVAALADSRHRAESKMPRLALWVSIVAFGIYAVLAIFCLNYTIRHNVWPEILRSTARTALMVSGFQLVFGSLGLLDEYGSFKFSKIHRLSKISTAAIESTEKGPHS